MFRRKSIAILVSGLAYVYLFYLLLSLKVTRLITKSEIYSQMVDPVLNLTVNSSAPLPAPSPTPQSPSGSKQDRGVSDIPKWQQDIQRGEPKRNESIYLAVSLQVRIYDSDLAKWTLKELKQWMHYVFWAGARHIYVCDHYKYENESTRLQNALKKYIDSNLVTYFPWSKIRRPMSAQVACYQFIIDKYKHKTQWQIAIDMDEYPYVHNDTKEGFLIRFLEKVPSWVSEVSMPNFIMLGQGDRTKDLVVERITRITSKTKKSNTLDKPIYRPQFVRAGLHHNGILKGRVQEESGKTIKNLHYWGARMQNWGPDTNKTFRETESFTEVREIFGPIIRNSLLSFGETDAFSTNTGP